MQLSGLGTGTDNNDQGFTILTIINFTDVLILNICQAAVSLVQLIVKISKVLDMLQTSFKL